MAAEGISLDQCLDLVNATNDDFILDKLSVTLNYPKYEMMNDFLSKRKKTTAGERYTSNIQLEDATNGGHVGMLFQNDTSNVNDTDHKVISEWKRYGNNVSYDQIQMSINKAYKTKQYDYLKSKKLAMYRKTGDDIQEAGWSVPISSSDATSVIGIPGWITMGTDDSTGGFTGGAGKYLDGTALTVGNLSSTTYPKWNNWYADHKGNLDSTFLDTLGDANRATDFEAPIIPAGKIDGVETGMPSKVAYYTSNNVIKQVEKIARNSDDRIGHDLGKYAGKTTYKGIPLHYVKLLDTVQAYLWGTDPLFAINFDMLYPVVLDGWYFNVDQSKNAFSHTVITQYIDLIWLIHCENKQMGGFLISEQ